MFHLCCNYSFRKVFAFDFDLASGSVSNKRVAIDVQPDMGVCAFARFRTTSKIEKRKRFLL